MDINHFDFSVSKAKLFHLGYLLLLDRLDVVQNNLRTKASYVLEYAKSKGFLTSVDLVSEDSDRFTTIIPCSLPYVDFLFLNEYEASRLSGVGLTDAVGIAMDALCGEAFEIIFNMGVNEWIIIHQPDGVWTAHRDGTRLFQPSLSLPQNKIAGTNGAGDALAAGVLFGIHEEWSMEACLDLGICAAAASLFHASCSDGLLPYGDCLALSTVYGYRKKNA